MKPPQDDSSPSAKPAWTDERLDRIIGNLLRIGVLLAAAVVLVGGILYLAEQGRAASRDYSRFDPDRQQQSLTSVGQEVLALRSRGLLALGLLLLIATPVARVLISSAAFLLQRDFLYVFITLLVLAILLFSLFSGKVG